MRSIILALTVVITCAAANAQQKPIGRITAAFGDAAIEHYGRSHSADLYTSINNDDCVKTQDAGVSVLLQTRLVLKLDAATCLRISEGIGQTNVVLETGTVQLFAGKRPAYMGAAAVQDDLARIEGADAVFLASYDREKHAAYYACEHGSVTIELTKSKKRIALDADQQVQLEHDDAQLQPLDRQTYNQHKRTLDRLGESIVKQGSEVHQTRMRAMDTQTALAQLAAAGWIDRQLLIHPAAPAQATSSAETTAKSSAASNSAPAPSAIETVASAPQPPVLSPATDQPDPPDDSDTLRAKPDKPDNVNLPKPDQIAREQQHKLDEQQHKLDEIAKHLHEDAQKTQREAAKHDHH